VLYIVKRTSYGTFTFNPSMYSKETMSYYTGTLSIVLRQSIEIYPCTVFTKVCRERE